MSTDRMIDVGVAAAQAAIGATGTDPDAAALRVGVLEFLRVYAADVEPAPEHANLLAAYRDWLATAVTLYSTGDEAKVREYMHRGAILSAELELAAATAGTQ